MNEVFWITNNLDFTSFCSQDVDNPEVTEYINFYENLIWLLSDLCMDKQFVAIN